MSLFRLAAPDACWICLSTDTLTYEHRYKASDIRRLFGREKMFIHPEGAAPGARPRVAQGPKSDALKFEKPICQACNSAVTQVPDHAYSDLVEALEAAGSGQEGLFKLDLKFSEDAHYQAVCRYFGKLLGNRLADMAAPIPIRLCDFVRGASVDNGVFVVLRDDPRGGELRSGFDGVAMITVLPDLRPVRVQTSLTVAATQFLYGMVFTEAEIAALEAEHPAYVETCRAAARATMAAPAPDPLLSRLGLERPAP